MRGAQFYSYAAVSSALTAAVVAYAYQTRVQFYPTVIFLVTSKFAVLILGNMGIMLTLLLGRVTKSIFFGQLRDVEVEILYDNARYAITETCLALTIFREELNTRVLTLFTALLFSKCFHWLCQSRVEYVESDTVSRWTHIRLVTLMLSLLAVDVAFVAMCVYLWRGPSVLILFGFEYTILAVSILSTLIRYALHVIDMNIEGNWPQKGSYLFFLEFATEVVRFLSYLVFFTIIFTYYGMPLHIVRDLWTSYVNLKRRLIIFNKYRKLTANMNERFPDATEEELVACEHTCIICRDHMDGGKKLPCGHIFHLDCLRLWLQQQQSCPTCRAEIPTDTPPRGGAPTTNNVGAPPAADNHNAAPGVGGGPAPGVNRPPPPGPRPDAPQQQQGQPPAPTSQHAVGPFPPQPFQFTPPGEAHHPAQNLPMPPQPFPFPLPPGMWGSMHPGVPPLLPPWMPPPPQLPTDAPVWYQVANPRGADVRAAPEVEATIIKTLAMNELFLCLERQSDDQGVVYLRIQDGWVMERPNGPNGERAVEPIGADDRANPFFLNPLYSSMATPIPPLPATSLHGASRFSGGASDPTGPASSTTRGVGDSSTREEVRELRAALAELQGDMARFKGSFQSMLAEVNQAMEGCVEQLKKAEERMGNLKG